MCTIKNELIWADEAASWHRRLPDGPEFADIRQKGEMNRAWDEWVDPENPPMRACIGVDLEPPHIVEIVVTKDWPGVEEFRTTMAPFVADVLVPPQAT